MAHRDRAWLDVDGDALRYNYGILRKRAGVPLMPMVKADSYGIGVIAVAQALGVPFREQQGGKATAVEVVPGERAPQGPAASHEPPWGLGVTSLDEAELLRDAGCIGRILCTTPLLLDELPRALALEVRPSFHRPECIGRWWTLSGGSAPWHLSIDTGMARAGVRWDAVASLRDALAKMSPEGVFTHFHSSDESPSSRVEQDARFERALNVLHDVLPRGVLQHRDNSGAIVGRCDGSPGHLARPGIALYAGMFMAELGLRQVAHLRTHIIDLREVLPGESVSYGATWIASGTHRIATLSVGYGDGYRRHLSNVGEVLIAGKRCPVVGRVTMDMVMVDVTGTPCALGDIATLLGTDGDITLTAEAVGARAGVSPYELLAGLRLRVPRIYHQLLSSTPTTGS